MNHMLFLVLRGIYADFLFEEAGEIVGVFKAQFIGGFGYRNTGLQQEIFGFIQQVQMDVIPGTFAGFGF